MVVFSCPVNVSVSLIFVVEPKFVVVEVVIRVGGRKDFQRT